MARNHVCPCGSGKPFSTCCEPYLSGTELPATAEALMRSRYTAYNLGRWDYLRATWHPRARPWDLGLGQPIKWIGLEILHTWNGSPDDEEGEVEFVARYKIGGRAQRLHEISRFVRRDERWLYVDGETKP